MPINLGDLAQRVQDGFITIQSGTHRDLNAQLRSLVDKHLRNVDRNVNQFNIAVFNILKEYALENRSGISDAFISQFMEPLLRSAEDFAAGKQQSLTTLYGNIDGVVSRVIEASNNENISRSIAQAKTTGTAPATLYHRFEDLNEQYALNVTEISRLDDEVTREVRRRYL